MSAIAILSLLLLTIGFLVTRDAAESFAAAHETEPIPHEGDVADDIAIWVHPTDRAASTIIGADRRGGLVVYDLQGREIQRLEDGASNNVDLRDDFLLDGELVSLVVSSRPRTRQIGFSRVDVDSRRLITLGEVSFKDFTPMGLCLYRSAITEALYVFAGNKKGVLRQWEVQSTASGIQLQFVRDVSFDSRIEGCVASDADGRLFVSEENIGIWYLDAEPDGVAPPQLVDSVEGGWLVADVEGLALVRSPVNGLLVASCQSADDFAVYRSQPPFTYVGRFRIVAGNGVDEVTHTDGVEIALGALGPGFPDGLLVVQDDENDEGNQNFKLVAWDRIVQRLDVAGH